jgi:hypothetical protein
MAKFLRIATAVTAVLVVSLALLAGPVSAQDYNGGTVATVVERDAGIGGASTSGDAGAAAAVSPSGALPFTGTDSVPVAQVGVALVGVGLLITLAVRARRTTT